VQQDGREYDDGSAEGRHTNGRIAAASVGAGVSINADRKLWPTVTVRVTYGR